MKYDLKGLRPRALIYWENSVRATTITANTVTACNLIEVTNSVAKSKTEQRDVLTNL